MAVGVGVVAVIGRNALLEKRGSNGRNESKGTSMVGRKIVEDGGRGTEEEVKKSVSRREEGIRRKREAIS